MKIFILAIILSVCLGCAAIESLWTETKSLATDDSKCQNVNFQALDEQIDQLVADQKIRLDQAVERKKGVKEEWDFYKKKEKTCGEFLDKVRYLTSA